MLQFFSNLNSKEWRKRFQTNVVSSHWLLPVLQLDLLLPKEQMIGNCKNKKFWRQYVPKHVMFAQQKIFLEKKNRNR